MLTKVFESNEVSWDLRAYLSKHVVIIKAEALDLTFDMQIPVVWEIGEFLFNNSTVCSSQREMHLRNDTVKWATSAADNLVGSMNYSIWKTEAIVAFGHPNRCISGFLTFEVI